MQPTPATHTEPITGSSGIPFVVLFSIGLALIPFIFGLGSALKPEHFNATLLIRCLAGVLCVASVLFFIFSFGVKKGVLQGSMLTIRNRLFFSRAATINLEQVVAMKLWMRYQGRGAYAYFCMVTDRTGQHYNLPLYAGKLALALAPWLQQWLYDPQTKVEVEGPRGYTAYDMLSTWYRGIPRDIDTTLATPERPSLGGSGAQWTVKSYLIGYILIGPLLLGIPVAMIIAVALHNI